MEQLNKWQNLELERFLTRKYVRYEDVRLELKDHLASAIEEKMKADANLRFDEALNDIEKSFGVGGFAQIVKEKEKALSRFWRKHIWQQLLKTLRPPVIFITIAVFLTVFQIHNRIGFAYLSPTTGAFFIILLAIIVCYSLYVRDEPLEKFLFMRTYYGWAGTIFMIIFYSLPSSVISFVSERPVIEVTSLRLYIISAYFTFSLLLAYILFYKIPNEMLRKLRAQYHKLSTTS